MLLTWLRGLGNWIRQKKSLKFKGDRNNIFGSFPKGWEPIFVLLRLQYAGHRNHSCTHAGYARDIL